MIRPWNWLSRWLWSLFTVVMSTMKRPAVTCVPLMVIDPVMVLVRPTAVLLWPNSVSLIRYPATDPVAIFHVPSTVDDAAPVVVAAPDWPVVTVVVVVLVERLSGAGALPSMKWMYTNGPRPTTTTTAAPPPITQRFQRRRVGVPGMVRRPFMKQ